MYNSYNNYKVYYFYALDTIISYMKVKILDDTTRKDEFSTYISPASIQITNFFTMSISREIVLGICVTSVIGNNWLYTYLFNFSKYVLFLNYYKNYLFACLKTTWQMYQINKLVLIPFFEFFRHDDDIQQFLSMISEKPHDRKF